MIKVLIIGTFLCLVNASVPNNNRIIDGQKAETIKLVKKIEPVKVEPKQEVAPIVQPAPVSTGGCVTGYFTGQYALDQIISHESGGNSCATNAGGCFGLLQACPGYPLKQACGGDPVCQIEWFRANKTGGRSWEQIWALWQTQGWW